jgi:hypothetical protein
MNIIDAIKELSDDILIQSLFGMVVGGLGFSVFVIVIEKIPFFNEFLTGDLISDEQ